MFKTNLALKLFLFCCLPALCVLNIFGCAEAEEGCLDITASNFDITADQDCCRDDDECCCTYPNMSLSLFYKLTSTDTLDQGISNFRLNQFYPLDNGIDSIMIDTFTLFVSNLSPNNSISLDSVDIIETISTETISQQGAVISNSFEDNVTLINFRQFRFPLGTYSSDLTVDQVDINLGLPEEISGFSPDDILEGHPLSDDYTQLFDENSGIYQSVRILFNIKSAEEQRPVVFTSTINSLISYQLDNPFAIVKGENLEILMRINVLDVFKGIIFDVPNEDIDLIINENLSQSVSILE